MIFILFLACIYVIAAHPTGVNLTSDGVSRFNVTFTLKHSPTGVLYHGIKECFENFVYLFKKQPPEMFYVKRSS